MLLKVLRRHKLSVRAEELYNQVREVPFLYNFFLFSCALSAGKKVFCLPLSGFLSVISSLCLILG